MILNVSLLSFINFNESYRTNLPKPTMELGGYPLSESLPSFLSWDDYYRYLLDYAKHYEIEKYIKVCVY